VGMVPKAASGSSKQHDEYADVLSWVCIHMGPSPSHGMASNPASVMAIDAAPIFESHPVLTVGIAGLICTTPNPAGLLTPTFRGCCCRAS
jgi:hypothetical protein